MTTASAHEVLKPLEDRGFRAVDIKFFPGSSRGLSAGSMLAEASKVTAQLLDDSIPDQPPVTALPKVSF